MKVDLQCNKIPNSTCLSYILCLLLIYARIYIYICIHKKKIRGHGRQQTQSSHVYSRVENDNVFLYLSFRYSCFMCTSRIWRTLVCVCVFLYDLIRNKMGENEMVCSRNFYIYEHDACLYEYIYLNGQIV